MADAYVGLDVDIVRTDNISLTGRIEAVDPATSTLYLRNVKTNSGALFGKLSIAGNSIKTLDLKKPAPEPAETPKPTEHIESRSASKPAQYYVDAYRDSAVVGYSPMTPSRKLDATGAKDTPSIARAQNGIESMSLMDPAIVSQSDHVPQTQASSYKDDSKYMADASAIETEDSSPEYALENTSQRKGRRKAEGRATLTKNTPQKPQARKRNPPSSRKSRHREAWEDEQVDGYKDEEFDFEANLGRFDKERVFAEIRRGDTTVPEELLVAHNRARKNFEPSENVLDTKAEANVRNESDDEFQDLQEFSSPLVASKGEAKRRGRTPEFTPSPRNVSVTRPADGAFRIAGEKRPIQTITPIQMTNAIGLCVNRFGPCMQSILDSAARAVANKALGMLGAARLGIKNHNPAPVIVVLAGANRSGLIAVIAGRMLSTLGLRVILNVVGSEYDALMSQELEYFANAGGRIVSKIEQGIAALSSPPELVVDGLLGPDSSLADIWEASEAMRIQELIFWVNHSVPANVISIDIPSGLSGLTGEPTNPSNVNVEPSLGGKTSHDTMWIRAKLVVATGLPRTGLQHAQAAGRGPERVSVANIGIPWRRIIDQWKQDGVSFGQGSITALKGQFEHEVQFEG